MKKKSLLVNDNPEEEDSLTSKGNGRDSAEENSSSRDILPKKESNNMIILNMLNGSSCNKQWFFQEICGLDNKIPKHIIDFDEKYLRCCLKWIHISAFGAASCNFSSKLGISPNYLTSRGISSRSMNDMVSLVIECPLAPVVDSVAINSAGDQILGTISASKSMVNILKSPLLQQLGALDSTVVGGGDLFEVKEAIATDFVSFLGEYGTTDSKPEKLKEMVLSDHECGSEPDHKRLASISSTNSTCSDQSSSSASAALSQGMLQCTWKNGYPQYLFSVDDQGEVYAANVTNIQSPDDKALDCVYSFHLKSGRQSENEIRGMELNLVAKMKVSTSVTLCPKNSEITETQFVLFGASECWTQQQNSVHTVRKNNKRLMRKVSDVFRNNQSRKQRPSSKNLGTSTILEDTSWESSTDACDILDHGPVNIMDGDIPPNLELAAIVVKDHVCGKTKEPGFGGWGLKFLKESGINQTDTPSENSVLFECCQRDSGECSTNTSVLIPARYHGGPRARRGGPSSLLERWRSGGRCDCGGWDMGCPLTVMSTRTNRMDSPPLTDSGECKTVDLFVEGSRQSSPIMKMTNVHEDLYFIHFQSTLSALQSFSIAAAIIHSHSLALRPKLYRV